MTALPDCPSRAPSRRLRRPPHRRGAVYLAVLGTSMIITLIGVSAILTSRALHVAGQTTHRATEARYLAHAAVELALLQIHNTPDWRNTHAHGQWSSTYQLGSGTFRYRLLSSTSTSLTNPGTGPVWLETEGQVGDAVRLLRVGLQPASQQPLGTNLVRNPDFAQGTRHWNATQPGDYLEYSLADAYAKAGSLRLRNRSGLPPGIQQQLPITLQNGMTYRIQLARRVILNPRLMNVHLVTTNTQGITTTVSHTLTSADTTWRHDSFTLTPTWTGDLAEAILLIDAHNHTEFLLDSVSITPDTARHTMLPAPGTWHPLTR